MGGVHINTSISKMSFDADDKLKSDPHGEAYQIGARIGVSGTLVSHMMKFGAIKNTHTTDDLLAIVAYFQKGAEKPRTSKENQARLSKVCRHINAEIQARKADAERMLARREHDALASAAAAGASSLSPPTSSHTPAPPKPRRPPPLALGELKETLDEIEGWLEKYGMPGTGDGAQGKLSRENVNDASNLRAIAGRIEKQANSYHFSKMAKRAKDYERQIAVLLSSKTNQE